MYLGQCHPVGLLGLYTRSRHLFEQDIPAEQASMNRQEGVSIKYRTVLNVVGER